MSCAVQRAELLMLTHPLSLSLSVPQADHYKAINALRTRFTLIILIIHKNITA